ncbi:hypothetical protein DHEL01_v200778 [Diaporthe helianthi]|uniref:Uncharacterized protein n=1 Tax=Diaporthe helianthi TaxID=158607 RepID=A0A2P5IE83_DIAHE|nr:hypothetical protein DHEL01_v200778 [Diaporthe helianthi]
MAFVYPSEEELSRPLSFGPEEGKPTKLRFEGYLPVHELAADEVHSHMHELPADDTAVNKALQQPRKKAPRPNKASRTFRHAQLAARQFIQHRRRRADGVVTERVDADSRLPISVIELILALLDVRGVARGSEERLVGDAYCAGVRAPERPCPTSAGELYDRLIYSRDSARSQGRGAIPLASWLLRSCDPGARFDAAFCVTWAELPQLLKPVIAEMRASLGYMEAFRSRLDLETEGCDYWLDLSHLRQCVFRLTGFWPHDSEHSHEAWAFGLPEDMVRLLYPQCDRFDHAEMALNLDEVLVGPTWDKLVKLEAIARLNQW